jgi:hypothetical protein
MGTHRSRFLTILPIAAVVGACHPSPSPLGAALVDARVLRANPIGKVTVTVSGSKLAVPITRTLSPAGGSYSTLFASLTPGGDYDFSALAYDKSNPPQIAMHGSISNQTIVAGQTANIIITLTPITTAPPYAGSVPIIDSASVSSLTADHGGLIQLQATAHDPDPGDTAKLVFSWTAACGMYVGTSTTPGSDAIAGRSDAVYSAPYVDGVCSLSLLVFDPAGHSASIAFNVTVKQALGQGTVAVELDGAPDVSGMFATPGQILPGVDTALTIAASDPDDDLLDYAWSSTCPGTFSTVQSDSTTFTLDADNDTASCMFDVVVRDGSRDQPKNATRARFGLGVGAIPIVLPPQFGLVTQSRDSVADGDTVVLAAAATDPAGGDVTYAWSASRGEPPTPAVPEDLGFDSSTFAVAATWTAPPATASGPIVTLVLSATSSLTGLTARYHYLLVPADSVCVTQPVLCPDRAICDPQTGECISHVPGDPFRPWRPSP